MHNYKNIPFTVTRAAIRFVLPFFYSIKVSGKDNTPSEGGFVAIANHVSYLDAPVIAALCPRNMRFVMYWKIYELPILTHLFKALRIIPIASPVESKKTYLAAKKEIQRALENGEGVFIFPEGEISYTGELGDVKKGTERFAKAAGVPVVSYRLVGLWGSVFSRCPNSKFSIFNRRKIELKRVCVIPADLATVDQIRNNLSQ